MGPLSREEDVNQKLRFIENMTRKADEVQNTVLAQILVQNSQTEYLLGLGLNGAIDKETFKSKIPMVTYEDLQPLIQRIVDGDGSPILCAQPIHEFVFSSGTSRGEIKLFPSIKEEPERRMFMHSICMRLMDRYVKGLDKGKGLYFMFSKSEIETPSGLMARSTLTSVYKSAHFKERIPYLRNALTTPNEALSCEDTSQSMYTQLLCGLYEREHVFWVGMVFASGLIRAIKFLQLNWRQLSRDIHTGSLNPEVTDPSIRKYMARILRPNPQLADIIVEECGKDDWEGIITRLWPNTKYLDVIVTGAMTQYIPTLDYFSGGLPIVCLMYASSECFFGINLDPLCKPSEVSYTIMPNMAYFEFLPYDPYSPRQPTHSDLVDLTKVEIGKEYEIVVTTFSGLYRYRVGDILRATGFHNSNPQFRFVRRKNMVLNIDTEKTDETELQAAVANASRLVSEVNASLVDYTSYADTMTHPGHYVIYWELSKDVGLSFARLDDEVLAQCCLAMEESFNSVYRRYRVKEKLIGPLEIRVVRNGTFEELMDHAISRGSSISQYKVPRCVSSKSMMDLLESRVVSRHFSPLLPHWIPEYSKEKMINE